MRGIRRLLVTVAIAFAAGVTATAGNLTFLAEGPLGRFDAEDTRLMQDAVTSLLLHEDVGASREWQNPKSAASGKVRITKAFDSTDGFKCKVLRLDDNADGLKSRATYTFCEIHPGDWMIHAAAKPAAKKPESSGKPVS